MNALMHILRLFIVSICTVMWYILSRYINNGG
jgi:hypothetical protein